MFNEEPEYLEFIPRSLVMFGGGGSSGGSSGKISYPQYMMNWHLTMLNTTRNLVVEAARGPWPKTYVYDPKVWFGLPSNNTAYAALNLYKAIDVDAVLTAIMANDDFILPASQITDIRTKAEALRAELVPGTAYGPAVQEIIDSHSAKLLQKINAEVLPKVDVGLRDVNAVIGSSFVIAREIAMENYTTEIADFSAKVHIRFWELRHELYKTVEAVWMQASLHASEAALKYTTLRLEKAKLQVSMAAELANAATLAQSKYGAMQTEQAIRNRTWKLDLYDHMNKTLASISGASPVSAKDNQSTAAAMFSGAVGMGAMGAGLGAYLGGAIAPAAAGAAWGTGGGPIGMAIGAGVGLIGGLVQGLLK